MEHVMRAEYPEGVRPGEGPVKIWHMVRGHSRTAMCGRLLEEDAATQSEEAWSAPDPIFCHTCGAMYLREIP